ncbi:unnamed protein product [Urochloa humidicola]
MATGLRTGTPSLHDNSSPSVAAWSRALRPQAAPAPAQARRAAGHEGTSTGADSATCRRVRHPVSAAPSSSLWPWAPPTRSVQQVKFRSFGCTLERSC